MIKKIAVIASLVLLSNVATAQVSHGKKEKIAESGKEIQWISFQEALQLNQKHPRKIVIDVYTDWCGWCKRMDATTYKDSAVIAYINKKYYAVRLNAETRDSIVFQDRVFQYKPEYKANELALSLLNGKMSYPTTVYLDEQYNMLSPVAGYIQTPTMQMILKYYGEGAYKSTTWEKYQQSEVDASKKAGTPEKK